ncbi:MAG: type II toxin-antitoxin system VapC family toxin [Verrucomicrobia bacterium]|nr:type II toxin-antitoxin system VapC family toxin [Verrucomicrobiota bacterium]
MLTVDANVWIASHQSGEPSHAECRSFVREITRRMTPLHAPQLVEVECACAVARRTRNTQMAEAVHRSLRILPSLELHLLDDSMVLLAVKLGTSLFLRGADAIYVATAHRTLTTLITLDAEVRRRASAVVPCLLPSEWLAAN